MSTDVRRAGAVDAASGLFPALRTSIPALVLLTLAAIVCYLDRQIIGLLIDPIRHDLGISDTQVSLLLGAAFGLFYAVFGLPIGYLVDRTNRKKLIATGMVLWSIATACCGLSTTFWELFAARAGVAVGEAALYPAAFSLLADLFHPVHRGRVFMAFGGGNAIGIGVSFLAGGLILQFISSVRLSWVPFLHAATPWHLAFIVCAVPGLILAPLILLIPEVSRQEAIARPGAGQVSSTLFGFAHANPRVFCTVFAMFGFITIAIYGMQAWMAAAYMRTMGLKPAEVAYLMAGLFLVGVPIGSPLLGMVADAMTRRGIVGGKILLMSVCALLAALGNVVWWTRTDIVSSFAVGLFVFVNQMGVTMMAPALLSEMVPNELRGRMSAAYLLLMSLVGITIGPTAVAFIADHVFKDSSRIGYSIAVVASPCLLIGSALAWSVRSSYRDLMQKKDAPA